MYQGADVVRHYGNSACRRLSATLILAIAAALAALLSGGCGEDPIEEAAVPDCGRVTAWDADGDGISDSIERYGPNQGRYGFSVTACDEDPSLAVPKRMAGELVNGVSLPEVGDGYLHRQPERAWGTLELLECLNRVGRDVIDVATIGVSDLSKLGGGPLMPHPDHQNGLDVDLFYVRRQGESIPVDTRSAEYDPSATRSLFVSIVDKCDPEWIMADVQALGFLLDGKLEGRVVDGGEANRSHFQVLLRGTEAEAEGAE